MPAFATTTHGSPVMSDLNTHDSLQRFIFDGCDIRGEVVTLQQSYLKVLACNPAPVAVQQLLGEFLAAAALLSSTLKFDGVITLQAQGDGPVPVIMAECNHHRGLRGTVRPPASGEFEIAAGATDLPSLLGKGVLAITIDPDKGERYQGIVPLDGDSLAACLEAYFSQSEQLKTRIWLGAQDELAGGLLIQALPKQKMASEETNAAQWQTVIALAETVKSDELVSDDHKHRLYLLFNELEVRLFDPAPLEFSCTCSEQRSLNAVVQFGVEEIAEILQEQGHIEISCQFCNRQYHFNRAQIDAALDAGGDTLH